MKQSEQKTEFSYIKVIAMNLTIQKVRRVELALK